MTRDRGVEVLASEGSASAGSVSIAAGMIETSLPRLKEASMAPRAMVRSFAHIPLHPEGWRDWPYETPATNEDLRIGARCQFQQATCLGDVNGSPVRTSVYEKQRPILFQRPIGLEDSKTYGP